MDVTLNYNEELVNVEKDVAMPSPAPTSAIEENDILESPTPTNAPMDVVVSNGNVEEDANTYSLPKYLKNFDDHTEYEAYINGDDVPLDNVSYCRNQDEVHYNPSYDKKYLTTKLLENGSLQFVIPLCVTRDMVKSVSYSVDAGFTWVTTENVDNENVLITTPTLPQYSEIWWKGDIVTVSNDPPYDPQTCTANAERIITGERIYIVQTETMALWHNIEKIINYAGFHPCTTKFEVYGNAMSLIYGDDFIGKDTFKEGSTDHQLYSLFFACHGLTSAKNLVLPVKELSLGCYADMFRYCDSLTEIPKFTATVLAESSYENLFRFCSALKKVELPDSTIAPNACYRMLYEATSIEQIKLGFTNFTQEAMDACLTEWNINTPNTNVTFTKKPNTNYSIGDNGIKEGWTVVEA